MHKILKYVLAFVGLLLADQALKLYFLTEVFHDWGFVSFHLVKNTGVTFGLFQDHNWVFIWVSIMVLGLLMAFYDQFPEKAYPFLLLVCIGLAGNLFDRILYGYVVDFIDLGFWPVFNVADSLISIGVAGIIVVVLFSKQKS